MHVLVRPAVVLIGRLHVELGHFVAISLAATSSAVIVSVHFSSFSQLIGGRICEGYRNKDTKHNW